MPLQNNYVRQMRCFYRIRDCRTYACTYDLKINNNRSLKKDYSTFIASSFWVLNIQLEHIEYYTPTESYFNVALLCERLIIS